MIVEDETVSIKIPAGVVDGCSKVSNKGNDAPGNSARRFNCSYRRVRYF
jgi:molecular chaperone DnaJ